MEKTNDIFYEALQELRAELKAQPDKYVKSSIIAQPYKKFFIQTYQIYYSHLKKYQLHHKGIIETFLEQKESPEE